MSAPSKANKPKKLDKGKKRDAPKKKKSSGSNLQVILAVVCVVVLLGVGIGLYFVFSGGEDKKPLAGNPGAPRKADGGAAQDDPAAPANPGGGGMVDLA